MAERTISVRKARGIRTVLIHNGLYGGQGRNRTAAASLFRTELSSTFNNLQGPGGLPKYL